jgi:uncharacterized membrane protein
MSVFLALKVVHVLAAIVAVGTSVTSTFWLARAGRHQDRLVWALEGARLFDRRIANPSYVLLLASGVAMVLTGTYRFDQGWISAAILLYALIAAFGIVVFRPAARLQRAEAAADPTSAAYARIAARTWWYSWMTTAVVAMIVVLMVTKPF